MDLCKYKNALGVPGKGIHSYRVFGGRNCRCNYDYYWCHINFFFFQN